MTKPMTHVPENTKVNTDYQKLTLTSEKKIEIELMVLKAMAEILKHWMNKTGLNISNKEYTNNILIAGNNIGILENKNMSHQIWEHVQATISSTAHISIKTLQDFIEARISFIGLKNKEN